MSVLERIVRRTRADLLRRRREVPISELPADPSEPQRDFRAALTAAAEMALIAEVKPRSPSRERRRALDVEALVNAYTLHAHAISVLCDAPFFGGGYPLLAKVRRQTSLPILAKDFIVDDYQIHEARAAGADAILLMAALLDTAELVALAETARTLGLHALVEVHDVPELASALAADAAIIGVNSRDLRTLEIDLGRARELLASVPEDRVRVAESGLVDRASVDNMRGRADAALIGTALIDADDPAAQMEELGWSCR